MTTQNALVRYSMMNYSSYDQKGASLVELMVASMLGVIAIAIVGGVFISGQKVAKEKSLQLLLLQNLTSTMQVFKDDLLRAGFDNNNGQSLKLSGAVNTLQVDGSAVIGFVYFRAGSNNHQDIRNIVYRKKGDKLQLCEKGTTEAQGVMALSDINSCYSLLDDKVIKVEEFVVTPSNLSKGTIQSAIVDVKITASIPNVGISESIHMKIKQRNWQ